MGQHTGRSSSNKHVSPKGLGMSLDLTQFTDTCTCDISLPNDKAFQEHLRLYHGSLLDRIRAIRTALNVTGRTKRQIVIDAEASWLAYWII